MYTKLVDTTNALHFVGKPIEDDAFSLTSRFSTSSKPPTPPQIKVGESERPV
jgi:hypothetical protein